MFKALGSHWPEYLMEAALLGLFMVSACGFGVLIEHPSSPVRYLIENGFLRRELMGLAMGGTAVALIYSSWGKQSGAHMNPAVTLTFYRLGKIAPWDAAFYVLFQFIGGAAGVLLMTLLLGAFVSAPDVNYVATLPGANGAMAAFAGEYLISFILMMTVLIVSNRERLARFTGAFAGLCVALFITFEAPVSGMSMNPARTFASAVIPQIWTGLWIYFLAPPAGMLLAAIVYQSARGRVACAKFHHQNRKRCIFCEFQHAADPQPAVVDAAEAATRA